MLTNVKPTQTTVLMHVPSMTNPDKSYEVRLGKDGNVYCTCPAWKFQRKPVADRVCKHMRAAQQAGHLPA